MTATRLVLIAEDAKNFIKTLDIRERDYVISVIYEYLSRKRRPYKDEEDIIRLEDNFFKLITAKYRIFFKIGEKGLLYIADIKENKSN